MVAPEDYEFVEPMFDKAPLQPIFDIEYDNEWERELHLHSALVPLYLGKNLDSDGSRSFKSRELVDYVATFYERSRVYHALFNDWINWIEEGHVKPYTTKRAGVHIFSPIYVQELEGPMRYQVAALNDLLDEFRGSEGDWRSRLYGDGERRYFGNVLNTCIQISQSAQGVAENEELNSGIEYLTKTLILIDQHESFAEENGLGSSFEEALDATDLDETPIASDIRNSFAHANYKLSYDDALELNKQNIDIELNGEELTQPIDDVISYIHRQITLMYALSTGVTLALYHISITEDYDDQIEILWNVLPGQIDEIM
ncbi:hypothetical protein [Halorubrum ezzemoulense]|uniref:hypothetical protein n=1 Tax=Halorubrum ezzemoulense TaxID=337243 RepID=UPI00117AEA9E|nr:hypothetical protein [Halorubrum ezzemoulense]